MRQVFVDVVSAGITKGISEGLRYGVEHGQAQLNVESIEAYDPEAEAKFFAALQALKDLKYPLLDQLEGLKDAPIDVIMDALYLESDTREDAPQYIRDLRPSSSQLTIPVYPEVRARGQAAEKSVAQVARQDKRIQARELEIENLEVLLETEADMKKAAEDKSVATLQEQVSGDARLDALSIDFDEELYPHMLTAIAGRRWVIRHWLRLAVMKCGESLEMRQVFVDVVSAGIAKGISEGLRYGVEHGQAQLNVESIEAYDPEAEAKFFAALQALKDLKYPLLDQLEGLKEAPIDVIMDALYLESDTGEDAPQYIRDLRPRVPGKKKKKCRIVCRTHGVGSAHHARSDGVPVSVPTVVPQGLALLLADAAIQTEFKDT
nr:hypothetical protein [Tanacetum cinerariifolium]